MTPRTRIERLEKRCPARPAEGATFKPNFGIRWAGIPRSEGQKTIIRALLKAIADPRATDIQRNSWRASIAAIIPALRVQLESEKRRACPQCEYPLYEPAGGGLEKCQRCGCLVHMHGDGHVTDARPAADHALVG